MAKTIKINGTRLDKVRMPLTPPGNGVVASLTYPTSMIHFSRNDRELCLMVPAYLAVELYRIGILPQDANRPVQVSLGGRPSGYYTVTDVRYSHGSPSLLGDVAFTLTRVVRGQARRTAGEPPSSRRVAGGGGHVTDITHYLNAAGELLPSPGPARKLASFLTLLIEAATGTASGHYDDSGIRCRTKACTATILTMLAQNGDEIAWHCPLCGDHGVIRNWQDTKWNQLKGDERPD